MERNELSKLKRENAELREVIEEILLNLDSVCGESMRTRRRAEALYKSVNTDGGVSTRM